MESALHDAYAATYDADVLAYDCHIADVLFGLCYEYTRPGQRLLDAGVGSGLSAQLFARAGLEIHAFDFSPAMLEICRRKGFAADLKQHDLLQVPWPYPSGRFDFMVSCGVFHFLADLKAVFDEAERVLAPGGVLAFTTRLPAAPADPGESYRMHISGDFQVFSHSPAYIQRLLDDHAFTRLKLQKCFVGEDIFQAWIARR
jgi:predicted TPR repeat methyltransferase